ncbi:hypothetical protein ACFSJ3_13905 [Corallincola platygyrae]|uniref:STAS/SEC14 domain-containing protein n=1 Tax=Corallincola platygyrae TaxID=1193278 RepID=A0ABW4XPS6_9GAMM
MTDILDAHGVFEFTVDRDMTHLKLDGSFNAEGVRAMHEYIVACLKALPTIPNLALVDVTGWTLSTPDSAPATRALHRKMSESGLAYVAYITDNVEIRRVILEELWDQHPNVCRGYFKSRAQAKKWLAKQKN